MLKTATVLATEEGPTMYALLFIVVFALLLGLAQTLGWTKDSRERAPETHQHEEPRSGVFSAR
jgi:hypothetical protein